MNEIREHIDSTCSTYFNIPSDGSKHALMSTCTDEQAPLARPMCIIMFIVQVHLSIGACLFQGTLSERGIYIYIYMIYDMYTSYVNNSNDNYDYYAFYYYIRYDKSILVLCWYYSILSPPWGSSSGSCRSPPPPGSPGAAPMAPPWRPQPPARRPEYYHMPCCIILYSSTLLQHYECLGSQEFERPRLVFWRSGGPRLGREILYTTASRKQFPRLQRC